MCGVRMGEDVLVHLHARHWRQERRLLWPDTVVMKAEALWYAAALSAPSGHALCRSEMEEVRTAVPGRGPVGAADAVRVQ